MAKKKLKKKVQRKPAVSKAAVNPVIDSAREIWLAGLGAFSVAQQEGEKAIDQGNKMFEKLVAEGSKLEKKTRKDVEVAFEDIRGDIESRVDGIRGDIESRVEGFRSDVESRVKDFRGEVGSRFGGVREQTDSVRKQASDNWDKLENIFEDRVARVLARLGIPTRDDVNGLSERVQKLAKQVEALDKKAAPKAVKKAVPRKPAVKKAAPMKAAPKAVKKTGVKKATVKKAAVKKAAPVAVEKPEAPQPKAA
jgi:poly(hydroxyalkanoate) granule-associated protein